jgi:outer membrane biosynthesis protein TonB
MRFSQSSILTSLVVVSFGFSCVAFNPTPLRASSAVGLSLKDTLVTSKAANFPTTFPVLEQSCKRRYPTHLFAEADKDSGKISEKDALAQAEAAIREASDAIEEANKTLGGESPRLTLDSFKEVDEVVPTPPKVKQVAPPTPPQAKQVAPPTPPQAKQVAPPTTPVKQVARPPPPPKKSASKDTINQALAAAVGGVILGGALGVVADVSLFSDMSLNFEEQVIPPAVLALLLGGGTFVVASNEDSGIGQVARNTLGGTTIGIGNGIKGVIVASAIGIKNRITAIPKQISAFVKAKVDDTVEEVKAVPSKVKTAAEKAVDDTRVAAQEAVTKTVADVKAVPSKVKTAAVKKIDETVEEVKAVPGKVKEAASKAATDAQENVKRKVDEVASIPAKVLNGGVRSCRVHYVRSTAS